MYGICGEIHSWIKVKKLEEFLTHRFFTVKVIITLSKIYPVTSFTPQEVKLAPLLYILCANDLSKMFKCINIKIYADDVIIYAV